MKKSILISAVTALLFFVGNMGVFAFETTGEPVMTIKVSPKHIKYTASGGRFITATLLHDKGEDFKKSFEVTITQNNLVCGTADIRRMADGVAHITATIAEETKPNVPVVLIIRPSKGGGVMEHVTVADISGAEPTNTDNSISISMPKPTGLGSATSGFNEFISIPGSGPNGGGNSQPGSKINLFPNPTVDEINIVTEGEVMWGMAQVVDLSGKVMKNFNISDALTQNTNFLKINVSDLQSGIYFVRFKTDKETYAKRIQIIR